MVQTVYSPRRPAARMDAQFERKVKNCIQSLVRTKLSGAKCPNGCAHTDVRVEIVGNWEEGEFSAFVTRACCPAFVLVANNLLARAADERRTSRTIAA